MAETASRHRSSIASLEAPPSAFPADGPVYIEGFGHTLSLELRDARVARFAAEGDEWMESGERVRLVSDPVATCGDHFVLRWHVQDLTDQGDSAIRQHYCFEGQLAGESADGKLSIRIVANFLQPAVVLANTSGPARLSLGVPQHRATA
jgi:hypothetical protein